MIVVSTGTNGSAFQRLLDAAAALGSAEEMVVQHGPGRFPARTTVTCVDYIPFAQYAALVERARVVITHGGVGSVLVALMQRKRPIVMPRLSRFGEAIDDHQLQLARRLEQDGLVRVAQDREELEAAVREVNDVPAAPHVRRDQPLASDLAAYLAALRPPANAPGSTRPHQEVPFAKSGRDARR